MKKLIKAILVIILIAISLFGATFTVYMFNLDMKLMAFVQPYLAKIYDKRKRERSI